MRFYVRYPYAMRPSPASWNKLGQKLINYFNLGIGHGAGTCCGPGFLASGEAPSARVPLIAGVQAKAAL